MLHSVKVTIAINSDVISDKIKSTGEHKGQSRRIKNKGMDGLLTFPIYFKKNEWAIAVRLAHSLKSCIVGLIILGFHFPFQHHQTVHG